MSFMRGCLALLLAFVCASSLAQPWYSVTPDNAPSSPQRYVDLGSLERSGTLVRFRSQGVDPLTGKRGGEISRREVDCAPAALASYLYENYEVSFACRRAESLSNTSAQRTPPSATVTSPLPLSPSFTPPRAAAANDASGTAASSCNVDAAGLVRCTGNLACQMDRAAGLLRCNTGQNCVVSGGVFRCSNGIQGRQGPMPGVTTLNNGTSAITDNSGLTRYLDGSYCITDKAAGLTRCFERR